MTRKDFVNLADAFIVGLFTSVDDKQQQMGVAKALAHSLSAEYSNFDVDKFVAYIEERLQ